MTPGTSNSRWARGERPASMGERQFKRSVSAHCGPGSELERCRVRRRLGLDEHGFILGETFAAGAALRPQHRHARSCSEDARSQTPGAAGACGHKTVPECRRVRRRLCCPSCWPPPSAAQRGSEPPWRWAMVRASWSRECCAPVPHGAGLLKPGAPSLPHGPRAGSGARTRGRRCRDRGTGHFRAPRARSSRRAGLRLFSFASMVSSSAVKPATATVIR